MPSTSATLAASRKSWRDEQYSSSSSSSQFLHEDRDDLVALLLQQVRETAESTPPDNPRRHAASLIGPHDRRIEGTAGDPRAARAVQRISGS
jgi:hypothetical protein